MVEMRRKRRLTTVGGVMIAGVLCAVAFCNFRPFDLYLLKRWEYELSTLPDADVELRVEQIAALGERSLPTLVAALHSDRQLVAATAATALRRELDELELRSTDESSRIVAGLAHELAARSNQPGPHSGSASMQLATRLLLWPINRKSVDGERLVADCELIIRSAVRSTPGTVSEQTDEDVRPQDEQRGVSFQLAKTKPRKQEANATINSQTRNEPLASEMVPPGTGGGLPAQLVDAPPLLPQNARVLSPSPSATTTEPPHFIAVQAPRSLRAVPSHAADEAAKQPSAQQPAVDSRESHEPHREAAAVPTEATARPNLREMADLDVMQKLAGDDPSLAREAVGELARRGFHAHHFRLAALLVDPDPNIRLELVRSLPQMSGIDSRPWLLWLSRDSDPAVRKAAVAVIATSSDSALQQRLRELASEETDDEVLRVVRQVLNARQANTIR